MKLKQVRDIFLKIPLISLHEGAKTFVELRVYYIIVGDT